MANLTEVINWETGIYQLETTDPVLGGADGIDNLQAKQLGNRTQYLKKHVDDLESGATIPPGIATQNWVTGQINTLDNKASARAATTGNITLSGTQTIDGVSLNTGDRVLVKNQTTPSQNGIYVVSASAWTRSLDANENAEVTAGMVVFVSEGTLAADTIWKLTTNDPIVLDTTALTFADITSGYAPLNSPSFTGNPSAPTPTPSDNDTSVATSAFVQLAKSGVLSKSVAGGVDVALTADESGYPVIILTGAITANINVTVPSAAQGRWIVNNQATGGFTVTFKPVSGAGVVVPKGMPVEIVSDGTNFGLANRGVMGSLADQVNVTVNNTTLNASDAGKRINANSDGINIYLPPLAQVNTGAVYWIHASAACTILKQGADTLLAGNSTPSSVAMAAGEFAVFVAGQGSWNMEGGDTELLYSPRFGASLAASGYQKLPSGLIIQWGVNSGTPSGYSTYSFPIAFPTAAYGIVGQCLTMNANYWVHASIVNASQFNIGNGNGSSWASDLCYWIAVGK